MWALRISPLPNTTRLLVRSTDGIAGKAPLTYRPVESVPSPELLQEGLARDFNRLVQDQRKALNLNISDRIVVSYSASARIAEAIAAHESYLRHELLAERLEPSATQNGGAKLSLSGEEIVVTVTRA